LEVPGAISQERNRAEARENFIDALRGQHGDGAAMKRRDLDRHLRTHGY
jgi:hypothetical protein